MKTLALAGVLGLAVSLVGWIGAADEAGETGRSGAGVEPAPRGSAATGQVRASEVPRGPARKDVAGDTNAELLEALARLGGQIDALDAKVAALTDELEGLARRPEPYSAPSPATPASYAGALARTPETQWAALELLRADFEYDAAAARRSARFLTPHELLERYGSPTSIRTDDDDGGVRWVYRDLDRGLSVTFALHADYVTGLSVSAAG